MSDLTRYPGTYSFQDDALSRAVFYGRKDEIVNLINKIIANRLVVIYAQSGAGKTSLLQAGISQPLRDENYLPLIVNKYDSRNSIFNSIRGIFDATKPHNQVQHIEFNTGSDLSLWHFFKTAEFWQGNVLITPVLILDQFEELLKQPNSNERLRFFADLGSLIRGVRPENVPNSKSELNLSDKPPTVRVVISLREDYFGALAEAYGYIPQIYHNIFRLLPLNRDAAKLAIINPARIPQNGFSFATKPFEFGADAVDELFHILDENNTGEVDPFHLQLQCSRIEKWVSNEQQKPLTESEITVKKSDVPGKNAIIDYYKDAIEHASQESQPTQSIKDISEWIENEFIDSGKNKSRVLVRGGKLLDKIKMVGCLVLDRILRLEKYGDEDRYELTHDLWIQTIIEYNKQFEKIDYTKIFNDELELWIDTNKDEDALVNRLFNNDIFSAYKYIQSRRDLSTDEKDFIIACDNALERIKKEAALGRANKLATNSRNESNPRCRMLLAKEALNFTKEREIKNSAVNPSLQVAFEKLFSCIPSPKGQPLRPYHTTSVNTLAIDWDNRWLVTGDEGGSVCLWDLRDKFKLKPIETQKLEHPISAMAMNPIFPTDNDIKNQRPTDTPWLVVGCMDGSAYLWNLKNADLSQRITLKRHPCAIKYVAISGIIKENDKDKYQWLVTASESGTVYRWNLVDDPDCNNPIPISDWIVHEGGIISASISKDNTYLFTAGSQDKTVYRFDLNSSVEKRQAFIYKSNIHIIAITWDNHPLLTGTRDGRVSLQRLNKNDQEIPPPDFLEELKGLVCAIAISHDNHWLIVGTDVGVVQVWDLFEPDKEKRLKPCKTWNDNKSSIQTINITPDNNWITVGASDGRVRLMDLTDLDAPPIPLYPKQAAILAMAMTSNPKNCLLATSSADHSVVVWDLKKPFIQYPIQLNIPAGNIRAIAINENMPWLATGSYKDGKIRLWDRAALSYDDLFADIVTEAIDSLTGHKAEINFNVMAFSTNGRWLVTCSNRIPSTNKDTDYWDPPHLWDMTASGPNRHPFVLKGHQNTVRAAAFSPDNKWLVTAGDAPKGVDDNTALLWKLTDREPGSSPIALTGHKYGIWAVTISHDNKWLLTAADDGTARLWELPPIGLKPKPRVVLDPKSWGIRAATFSSDSKWLAFGNFIDGNIRIWDMESLDDNNHDPEQQHPATYILPDHRPKLNFNFIAFSPDSRWLVTCGNDTYYYKYGNKKVHKKFGQALLWDMSTLENPVKRVFKLGSQENIIRSAVFSSFSPNASERWLVTVGDDAIVRLWDLTVSDPTSTVVELRGHEGAIWSAAFTQDDHWLITGGDDGRVCLWSLRQDELIRLANLIVGRNLTEEEWQKYFPNQQERKTFEILPADPYALASIKGWINRQDNGL